MPDTKQGQTGQGGQSGQKGQQKRETPPHDPMQDRKPQDKEAGHRDNR